MTPLRYTVRLSEQAVWVVTVDADCPEDAILGARIHWVARQPPPTARIRVYSREITHAVVANVQEVPS
jgi:hypothetical protein